MMPPTPLSLCYEPVSTSTTHVVVVVHAFTLAHPTLRSTQHLDAESQSCMCDYHESIVYMKCAANISIWGHARHHPSADRSWPAHSTPACYLG